MRKIFLLLCTMLSFFSYSKTVLTNTQATYTLTSMLAKNTKIDVKSVFENNVSMSYDQNQSFKNIDMSKFKDVVAVVDLQKVWFDDALFENARRQNISVIEIDAAYSYRDVSSLALLINNYSDENKKDITNPYVWLDFNNLTKMARIISHDLSLIFKEDKKQIEKNLDELLAKIDDYQYKYLEVKNIDGVILLSEDLNYLISYMNIYSYYSPLDSLKAEDVEKLIKETGIKIFVSDKGVKKDIREAINKNGAKLIILKTGNLPYDDEKNDELMAKDGLFKIFDDNLKALKGI